VKAESHRLSACFIGHKKPVQTHTSQLPLSMQCHTCRVLFRRLWGNFPPPAKKFLPKEFLQWSHALQSVKC